MLARRPLLTAALLSFSANAIYPQPPLPPPPVFSIGQTWGSPKHRRHTITPWIPRDRRKEQEAALREKAAKVWEEHEREQDSLGVAIMAMCALMEIDD
jgi:hypothetical protein